MTTAMSRLVGRRHRRRAAAGLLLVASAAAIALADSPTTDGLGAIERVSTGARLHARNVTISDRGEVVGYISQGEPFDDPRPAEGVYVRDFAGGDDTAVSLRPGFDLEVAVSGDGCGALLTFGLGNPLQIVSENRCPSPLARSALVGPPYDNSSIGMAVDRNTTWAVVGVLRKFYRVNLESGELQELELMQNWWAVPEAGVDISDDGTIISGVVYVRDANEYRLVIWNGTAVSSTPAVGDDRWVLDPSLSGDGRWVSYTSGFVAATIDLPGIAPSLQGPWVFIAPTSGNATPRVMSDPARRAVWSDLSRDGTQLVYGSDFGGCRRLFSETARRGCPVTSVQSLYGREPGLAGSVTAQELVPQTATDNCGPPIITVVPGPTTTAPEEFDRPVTNAICEVATYTDVSLSGNGRWLAWTGNGGPAGATVPAEERHVFRRSRDRSVTIDPLDFGQVPVDATRQLTTTVRNTGTTSFWLGRVTTTATRFTVVGLGSTDFRVVDGERCAIGGSLPPGGTCTIAVEYQGSPTPGSHADVLDVIELGFDAGSASGRLLGATSAGAPGPSLRISPNPAEFGEVDLATTSAPLTLTVTNAGTERGVVSTRLEGANAGDFSASGCDGVDLAPGASCTISSRFAPTAVGTRSADLVAVTSGSSASALLVGTGLDRDSGSALPELVATPDPIDFGEQDVGGTTGTTTVTVSNAGTAAGVVATFKEDDPADDFAVERNDCNEVRLAPGESCTMEVRFQPRAGGPRSAELLARSGASTASVDLLGTGIAFVTLEATPDPVDFGQVPVGFASPITPVSVTNAGNVGDRITTRLAGRDAGDFFVQNNGCDELELAPGSTCIIEVGMLPTAGGDRSAVLAFASATGDLEIDSEVGLVGQGRFDPLLSPSPSATTRFGISVVVGQGFPGDADYDIEIVGPDGSTLQTLAARTDANGVFRVPYAPNGELALGDYVMRVAGTPTVFDDVEAPLLIVLPTFQPQGASGPAFRSSVIVTRG